MAPRAGPCPGGTASDLLWACGGPHAPHCLGAILASGLGLSQIQALREAAWGSAGGGIHVALPGMALSAWLSEELVRAAAFQGGVPREVLPPPHN